MNKKQLSFGLAGLLVFAWVVLRDVSKTKSWHDFFVAPPPKPCKLLEKAEPLSITKETNQRMKGFGQSKSEKVRFSLFEDMLNNVKKADQEAVSNVKSESPLPEPVKATKKIIVKPERVVQKVNKIVPSPKQEKNYFPVSFERKGRKKALKVKNSFISGHVYGTQELKHGRSIKGISLNPSDYIPSLDCTRALKRDCSFSYFREKSLLGRIDAFTGRSSNFLNVKRSKNLNGLCSDIQRELRRSDQIKIAAKECNNKLIPIYKEQIKNLEAQNRQIDKTLVDPRFSKDDPVKYFQLKSLKNNNIMAMGELVERINKLQFQSESVAKEDKEAIADLYSEKLRQDLIQHILKSKIHRNGKF